MSHALQPRESVGHPAGPAPRTTTRSGHVRGARVATALLTAATLAGGALGSTAHAAPSAPAAASTAELRGAVVASVNVVRAAHGCKPLTVAKRLTKAAQRHAKDMSVTEVFSHTSADGRSWVSRIRATGWTKPAGENIARGFDTPAAVMTGWLNSPGHRRNILNCSFRHIGVGFSADGLYWVQDFGY